MLVRNLVLATVIFLLTFILGMLVAQETAEKIMKQLGELLKPLRPVGTLSVFFLLLIFANNAIKALGAVLFGVLLGLPPLLFISINGFYLSRRSLRGQITQRSGICHSQPSTSWRS